VFNGKVEKIDMPIGFAQGLLYAFDSLYVVVNGAGIKGPDGKANGSGLYRLTDRLYRAQSMAEAYDATLEAVGELFGCEKI